MVRRGVKNTIFLDLFSIPKYQLQMLRTLHPEMTDVTEADIRTVTLSPIVTTEQYNDLAILVRDKLMIFVEAQSTWTINILVRILMYTATTYKEYISEKEMNVYGTKKLGIPEPEFYVVYTGKREVTDEIISLRKDFWNNPNAKLDLEVRVIHAENKADVIGQYIILAHVIDDQLKLHGRKTIAIENAFRICKDMNVLREYLDKKKKELIKIMDLLFDQEYATEMYAMEREREARRQATVEVYKELGIPFDETIQRLAAKFSLKTEEATEYINQYWKKS